MKILLIPLLTALALPTAVNAETIPDSDFQPKDYTEWFHLGAISGQAATFCTMWIAGKITLEDAKFYREGTLSRYKKEGGERGEEAVIAGYNLGISGMQKLDENTDVEDFGVRFKECEKLKFK